MAKLHGKAKAEFLARMARGRRKAGITHKARRKRIIRTRKSSTRLRKQSRKLIRSTTRRRKTIKQLSRKITKMARRRRTTHRRRTSSRGIISKIPLVNNPMIRKVATGIGLATIGVGVISLVAPSIAQNPIVRPALAFIGGGIPAVIGQVVLGGGLGGLTGGNGINASGSGGFA